jgi:uncharacterized phage protein (TIGR01671 family)
MREIKFRCWDKITTTMVDAKTIEFDNNGLNKFTGKNYLTEISYRIRKDDNIHYQNRYKSEFELMQYTGLNDKNGKEIYEGDILQPKNNAKEFYEVVFHDAGFKRKYTFTQKYEGKSWIEIRYFEIFGTSHVVVGNIYENPELI